MSFCPARRVENGMLSDSRQKTIYEHLRVHGSVQVTNLGADLGVSEMTVRRNLEEMARAGLLKRVHGGAVLRDPLDMERSFFHRQVEELPRKMAIASLARELIQPGQTIFLDGSTTCHELAKQLTSDTVAHIVTNSLAVLLELKNRPNLELTILGGTLNTDGNTVDGPLAVENAEKFSVDVCFFSAYGFTPRGISNPGLIGTSIKKAMIRGGTRSVLLADATKFGRRGFVEFCPWNDVDLLVTDSLSDNELQPIAEQSVELRIARVTQEELSHEDTGKGDNDVET